MLDRELRRLLQERRERALGNLMLLRNTSIVLIVLGLLLYLLLVLSR